MLVCELKLLYLMQLEKLVRLIAENTLSSTLNKYLF